MEKPAFRIAYSENVKSISVSENYEESKEKMCFSIGENEEQNSNVLSIKDSFSPFALPYVGVYSTSSLENAIAEFKNINHPIVSYVACQAKRKKVTRKTQKTALIYPIYGNQSGFSYVI